MPETEDKIPAFYPTKPPLDKKFRPNAVKSIIQTILNEELSGKQYDAEQTPVWSRSIADKIKNKIKELNYSRYKIIAQVLIGEQRGEGVRMATRCLWDAEADNYATQTFMSDSLFCVAVAYGVYYY
ncbi:dynein light chain Tctex-type protein 2B-like [Daphnia carinata]|uniref:dynein light chain Tctex-type protein 2B-like n=1 Tax=Daphnia carinata TaxID=120202 RepID=UPI0025810364|nr:dynein light chain Tctex-type protein 2B-like [Daphnia carinata]